MKVIITLEIHDPDIIESAVKMPKTFKDRLQNAINHEWPYCPMRDMDVTEVELSGAWLEVSEALHKQ